MPLDELPHGELRAAQVGRVSLVLARKPDGSVRALHDRCPHMAARLSNGEFGPMVIGHDPGTYSYSLDTMVIRCPWHRYEFDVDTGRCPADPERSRIRVYDVAIEDGMIVIDR